MYKTPFYIENPLGNNAFSYEQKTNKKLFVPSLKKIHSLQEIKLGNQIVFEDFDFDDVLISATGLKNFYEMDFLYKGKIKKCYLFDNHNHAFFFWFLAKKEKIITENGNILLHIDAHSDMRIPINILSSNNKNDLEKIFHYTNFELNVGNYIFPARELGLIQDIIQIRDDKSLEKNYNANILNLDLDFFAPELDYIEYNKKKEFILRHFENVDFLTVASSPFFINQTLAIQVFQDIFKNIQIV
ncbi:hypothetical protein HGA92_04740 [Candidatus Gracilibacteria bacterium]|nr:hypothetical protein [Candidatus Gracilibacteria bacterium]NUJ98458.1 hypothetical protein [Candidatus Gracilibacteria bacterium]